MIILFYTQLLLVTETVSLGDMLFQRTENMTLSSWNSFRTKESKSRGPLACASECLYEKDTCNAWRFQESTKDCQLAKVKK